MTHEQVDVVENKLRQAQRLLEEAAVIVSRTNGEDANHVWNRVASHANDVGDTICGLWRLRPQ